MTLTGHRFVIIGSCHLTLTVAHSTLLVTSLATVFFLSVQVSFTRILVVVMDYLTVHGTRSFSHVAAPIPLLGLILDVS